MIVLAASSEEPRMSSDGHNIMGWIAYLSLFTGTLSAKCDLDITSILQFVYNQMIVSLSHL